MLGVCLLYVGIVLINNGFCRLYGITGKAVAVMNIFVGMLSMVINVLALIQGDFYSAGTGLLFGFTYLFTALNQIYSLDMRPYGIYCLFVAINTLPCAVIDFQGGDPIMAVIWILWGVLWLTGFIELNLKKDLGKFVPYLCIFEGVVTAWIPGFLMLRNMW